jgi:hypothetical protein
MQMREIYDPGFVATMQDYHRVLRCWRQSASAGHPDAAEHANLLLRLMESRSGVHDGVLEPSGGETSERIVSHVYKNEFQAGYCCVQFGPTSLFKYATPPK